MNSKAILATIIIVVVLIAGWKLRHRIHRYFKHPAAAAQKMTSPKKAPSSSEGLIQQFQEEHSVEKHLGR